MENGLSPHLGNFFSEIYFCDLVHFSFVPFNCLCTFNRTASPKTVSGTTGITLVYPYVCLCV